MTSPVSLYQNVQAADAARRLRGPEQRAPSSDCGVPQTSPSLHGSRKLSWENSGRIDPEQIEDYISADGYTALVRALTEMSPDEVLQEVNDSGLRGRGGGGYPSGLKWATVAKSPEPLKYVICNADEGDPGAFMDRAVLESDPHRVIGGDDSCRLRRRSADTVISISGRNIRWRSNA